MGVAAAFGAYCGYPLADCKAKITSAFSEFAAIASPDHIEPLCEEIFGRRTGASQQLYDFAHSSMACPLHSYPEAFVLVQEYSFVTVNERIVESEHIKTKFSTERTLKDCKPAYTCARQRKNNISQLVNEEFDYVRNNW